MGQAATRSSGAGNGVHKTGEPGRDRPCLALLGVEQSAEHQHGSQRTREEADHGGTRRADGAPQFRREGRAVPEEAQATCVVGESEDV